MRVRHRVTTESQREDALCTIGVHTVRHPDMSLLNIEEQLDELVRSKANLESLCHLPVRHCAIPGGYNENKISISKEAGFLTQVNGWGGIVRLGMNQWDIPRIIP